jgi:GMP synthase-like glutamine amidotransferase
VRVLAFRHSPSDGLGLIANVLDAHGIASQYTDLYAAPAAATDIEHADALILLGGSMSANDNLSFIQREIGHVQAAIQSSKPLLGICLGAQVIAKALGSKVYSNGKKEIGWAPVMFTSAAQNDALFHGHDSEVIFHWHGETFDLPEGAELLASSAACRHQAFRFGDRVYGLQFHLEVTPQMISQWCQEDEACGAREASERIDPFAHSARAMDLARLIFGRWCELVKAQTEPRPRSLLR